MMARLIALGTGLLAGVACAAMKTPETSSLFEKVTDPGSGCISYVLRPGCVGYHQQSWYFTQKSMTDDGRYLFFHAEPDERVTGQKRMRDTGLLRTLWVIDFAVDRIRPIRIYGMRVSSLDVRNNRLWFIREGWVAYHDLGGSPTNITPVCRIPETLSVPGKAISYYCSHLTFNADHTKLFLDTGFDDERPTAEYWQGLLNLKTGVYENWTKTDFCVNHGQICPADDTLGLAAWEGCWMKTVVKDGVKKLVSRPGSEVYPRLWLFRKGQKTMIPAKAVNYATHEHWAEDGKSFYWCSGKGIYSHDLATGKQTCCSPLPAAHADMTADNSYIVFDWAPDWYRGCAWQVCFYNRANGKHLYFHSNIPALCPRSSPSFLHPDPHPQFVCNGRYIVSTLNGSDGRMSVAVTPTAQLRARTE